MENTNEPTNYSPTENKSSTGKWVAGIIGAAVLGGGALLLASFNNTNSSTQANIQPVSQQRTISCQYSCTGSDKDCSDFSTHEEAQEFFDCCGFTASNDPMKLDSVGVGDGIACESLP